MDIQVQELIDKIKRDGLAEAERAAQAVTDAARKEAADIIAAARRETAALVAEAKAETERYEKSAKDAMEQAARNLTLAFRDSVCAQLAALTAAETARAYSPDMLKTLVPETVKAWAASPDEEDLAVLLPAQSLAALESGLRAALAAELARGIVLKADPSLEAGFRIGTKDGAAYYDYSAEAVASLFASYLNPKIAAVLNEAACAALAKG